MHLNDDKAHEVFREHKHLYNTEWNPDFFLGGGGNGNIYTISQDFVNPSTGQARSGLKGARELAKQVRCERKARGSKASEVRARSEAKPACWLVYWYNKPFSTGN